MFLATFSKCLKNEKLEDGSERVVLSLPPALAPVKVAVFPLTKKDGLPDIAREIMGELKFDHNCLYEEKDAIGKRYRRMDALGTPFCVTVDHQTLEDGTVTIRYRDTMEQSRVAKEDLAGIIGEACSFKNLLK
jgi:glycyl-tRNA synthetase